MTILINWQFKPGYLFMFFLIKSLYNSLLCFEFFQQAILLNCHVKYPCFKLYTFYLRLFELFFQLFQYFFEN